MTLAASLSFGVSSAQAQTGSHIMAVTSPLSRIQLTEPGEITEIRSLLGQKQAKKAVKLAKRYMKSFEMNKVNWGDNSYFALTALCSAHTMNGDRREALEACSQAVERSPNHWQAINNRGTAHFVAGRYKEAMDDYQRALDLEPSSGDITRVIQHNISLLQAKLGDD